MQQHIDGISNFQRHESESEHCGESSPCLEDENGPGVKQAGESLRMSQLRVRPLSRQSISF